MADVVKAAARPSRSERKRPQAAPSADSEVLRYLMSKKRVRRAVALDSEESSPEEREASRLLLLSSIGHALLDSSEQHPTAVKSPRNVPDGFIMPLKPKVSNHQQGQNHTEIPRMTTKYNSTNSRDLVPHELPPEAFGEYPSLEIHNRMPDRALDSRALHINDSRHSRLSHQSGLTIANTVVAAEPRPAKQRDAAAGVEEPVETTVIRENQRSSQLRPHMSDLLRPRRVRSLQGGALMINCRLTEITLPIVRPAMKAQKVSGEEAKPAAKATSVLDLGGVLESGDDDDGVCFGPRPPGDLSPAAMGLIEDYVPGHEVIDLDDSDGEESPAMSVELRDRKSPRVKELTEEEEACLFEDAGGNAKQENTASLAEADASEGPVEEVIVIDLEGEEDAEAGRLSPRGSAYSVISSMDAADNKVEDLGEAS
ncbi:hypothetical protein FOZ60_006911 [Perkinsus olseni]|uniref:Uncharacterized protein n=1 Tax=Perkinsus olseni TaxID=32597 RepID=A0A7J6PEY9_PEROL|nr:hypothetical protein FOZ60_006911 [Perkinsus olseni]